MRAKVTNTSNCMRHSFLFSVTNFGLEFSREDECFKSEEDYVMRFSLWCEVVGFFFSLIAAEFFVPNSANVSSGIKQGCYKSSKCCRMFT